MRITALIIKAHIYLLMLCGCCFSESRDIPATGKMLEEVELAVPEPVSLLWYYPIQNDSLQGRSVMKAF